MSRKLNIIIIGLLTTIMQQPSLTATYASSPLSTDLPPTPSPT